MTLGERVVRGGRLAVARDADEMVERAARVFRSAAVDAVRSRRRFFVALSGGSTPRRLYAELARKPPAADPEHVDWPVAEVFWGDERCVPPDHPDSNYGMAFETLLRHVPVPRDHIHRIRGEETDPERAAALYESELRTVFPAPSPRKPS